MGQGIINNYFTVSILVFLLFSSVSPMVLTTPTSIITSNETFDHLAFLDDEEDPFKTWYTYDRMEDTSHKEDKGCDNNVFSTEHLNASTLEEPLRDDLQPGRFDNGLMDSAWPMKCHDQRHTCQSQFSTQDNPHTEKWRFGTSSDIESSPVVDEEGIIYVASVSDATLHALCPNGTEKWIYQAGGLLWSTPALAEDGTIYVTSWDANLHALFSSNGTLKWKVTGGASIDSSPAIGNNGTIYFGSLTGGHGYRVYAIHPNGTEYWSYLTDDRIYSDPAIGENGTIYIGSGDSGMYALHPNGTLHWRFDTGDIIKGHPSIDTNGIIYFSSYDDYLYAVYPDGTMKWRTHTTYTVQAEGQQLQQTAPSTCSPINSEHSTPTTEPSNGALTSMVTEAIPPPHSQQMAPSTSATVTANISRCNPPRRDTMAT
jgi:outer membrane protein assembly factor BamB